MARGLWQHVSESFVSESRLDAGRPGRFLLAIIDGGGTVPPALGLARSLVGRGHQVRVLADPTVAADAESAGCAFSPWREAPHFRSREEQTAVVAAFESRRPYRAIKAVRDFAGPEMTRRYARDVVSTAREAGVDAVLAEGALPGIVIGALCTGLPTAALMANIYLRPTQGFPLMGTGWSPARGLPGRARDWLAPTAARWLLDRTLPRVNAVLSGYGRPPLTELFGLFDRCDRVLVMTSPSFDFAVPQLPDNVRYVGPQLDDPDWAAPIPWQRLGTEPLVLGRHQLDLPESDRPAPADSAGPRQPARPWRRDHGSRGRPAGDPGPRERRSAAGRTPPSRPRGGLRRYHPRRPWDRPENVGGRRAPGLHADGPGSKGQHRTGAAVRRRRTDQQVVDT